MSPSGHFVCHFPSERCYVQQKSVTRDTADVAALCIRLCSTAATLSLGMKVNGVRDGMRELWHKHVNCSLKSGEGSKRGSQNVHDPLSVTGTAGVMKPFAGSIGPQWGCIVVQKHL